jgi:hypothetical protein
MIIIWKSGNARFVTIYMILLWETLMGEFLPELLLKTFQAAGYAHGAVPQRTHSRKLANPR